MKKLLILGATGMAGHVVYNFFSKLPEFEVVSACFRSKLTEESYIVNVRDENSVVELLKTVRPDYLINCVGVLIRGSKESIENAIFINAYLPHFLSRIMQTVNPGSQLIHISTDCVFSGRAGLYSDSDVKDATDIYGLTKNLGEVSNKTDLTIRTSIIGPEIKSDGEGLFHWFFSQRTTGNVNGYTKNIWGGVTTLELAKVIKVCIQENVNGLIQVSNGREISKFELLELIKSVFGLKVKINPVEGPRINKSILPTVREGLILAVPDYRKMIEDLREFMIENNGKYEQYLREV